MKVSKRCDNWSDYMIPLFRKFNLAGPINDLTGYGYHVKGLITELVKIAPHVVLHSIYPGPKYNPGFLDKSVEEILDKEDLDLMVPSVLIYGAHDYLKISNVLNVLYTVFESEQLPVGWPDNMKKYDEVWTASHWGAKAISKCIDRTVKVVPEGYNPSIFNPNGPILDTFNDGYFKFLVGGKWEPRKNQSQIALAFAEEFEPNEKVKLMLSCHNPFTANEISIKDEIQLLNLPKHAPIKLIDWIPKQEQFAQLMRSCQCYVDMSRGEGWNLPLCEALGTGLPAITTMGTAHSEYVNKDISYVVDIIGEIDAYDAFWTLFEGTKWTQANHDQLKKQMRYVFCHQEEAKEKGLKAAEEMLSKWTWGHSAIKFMKVLTESVKEAM